MKDAEQIRARAIGATILLGPSIKTILAVTAIGQLDSLHYSRAVEERADLTGSDTCAQAGYDPWGLVWLFQDFSANMPNLPEVLLDHPDFDHRVAALEHHFEQNPARFAAFNKARRARRRSTFPQTSPRGFLDNL